MALYYRYSKVIFVSLVLLVTLLHDTDAYKLTKAKRSDTSTTVVPETTVTTDSPSSIAPSAVAPESATVEAQAEYPVNGTETAVVVEDNNVAGPVVSVILNKQEEKQADEEDVPVEVQLLQRLNRFSSSRSNELEMCLPKVFCGINSVSGMPITQANYDFTQLSQGLSTISDEDTIPSPKARGSMEKNGSDQSESAESEEEEGVADDRELFRHPTRYGFARAMKLLKSTLRSGQGKPKKAQRVNSKARSEDKLNPKKGFDKEEYIRRKQREVLETTDLSKLISIAADVGQKLRSSRQCRTMFGACTLSYDELSRLLSDKQEYTKPVKEEPEPAYEDIVIGEQNPSKNRNLGSSEEDVEYLEDVEIKPSATYNLLSGDVSEDEKTHEEAKPVESYQKVENTFPGTKREEDKKIIQKPVATEASNSESEEEEDEDEEDEEADKDEDKDEDKEDKDTRRDTHALPPYLGRPGTGPLIPQRPPYPMYGQRPPVREPEHDDVKDTDTSVEADLPSSGETEIEPDVKPKPKPKPVQQEVAEEDEDDEKPVDQPSKPQKPESVESSEEEGDEEGSEEAPSSEGPVPFTRDDEFSPGKGQKRPPVPSGGFPPYPRPPYPYQGRPPVPENEGPDDSGDAEDEADEGEEEVKPKPTTATVKATKYKKPVKVSPPEVVSNEVSSDELADDVSPSSNPHHSHKYPGSFQQQHLPQPYGGHPSLQSVEAPGFQPAPAPMEDDEDDPDKMSRRGKIRQEGTAEEDSSEEEEEEDDEPEVPAEEDEPEVPAPKSTVIPKSKSTTRKDPKATPPAPSRKVPPPPVIVVPQNEAPYNPAKDDTPPAFPPSPETLNADNNVVVAEGKVKTPVVSTLKTPIKEIVEDKENLSSEEDKSEYYEDRNPIVIPEKTSKRPKPKVASKSDVPAAPTKVTKTGDKVLPTYTSTFTDIFGKNDDEGSISDDFAKISVGAKPVDKQPDWSEEDHGFTNAKNQRVPQPLGVVKGQKGKYALVKRKHPKRRPAEIIKMDDGKVESSEEELH